MVPDESAIFSFDKYFPQEQSSQSHYVCTKLYGPLNHSRFDPGKSLTQGGSTEFSFLEILNLGLRKSN